MQQTNNLHTILLYAQQEAQRLGRVIDTLFTLEIMLTF